MFTRDRSGSGLAVAATYCVPRGAVPRDPVPPGSSHPCTIALLQCPLILFACLLLFVLLLPPLEVAFRLPPLCCCCRVHCGFEGSHPFACIRRQARSFSSVAGGRCRSPPSVAGWHSPPPLEVLLPHPSPRSTLVELVGTRAPGVTTPRLLCARHRWLCAGMAR